MVPAKAGLSDKRVEGVITEVLQRKQLVFTGSLHSNNSIAFFIPGGDKSMPDFFIPPHKLSGAKNGDKVVAKFVKWNKSDKKPEGEIVAVIDAQNAMTALKSEMALNAYKYVMSLATLLQSHGSIAEFQSYVNQKNTQYIR